MAQKNTDVDFINKQLKIHGTNQYGDPYFRVVFSDDQLENRKGDFDIYDNGTFIRREINVIKELPKYPWIKSKWILERWAPGEISFHPSLISIKDGTYFCVYTFQDKDCNYLKPLWKVTEIIVKHLLHPRSKAQAMAEDEVIDKKFEENEVDKIELELAIQSDESKTKDPDSIRESLSTGYGEEKRTVR